MYLGFLDISIGLFFIFGNWGFLGAALAFYFITDRYTIVQEEKILSERFPTKRGDNIAATFDAGYNRYRLKRFTVILLIGNPL